VFAIAVFGADEERHPVKVGIGGTGPSQRSIVVGYSYGGCEHAPKVLVQEDRKGFVFVDVTVLEPTGDDVVCTLMQAFGRKTVKLEAPLGGRHILGWNGRVQPRLPGGRCGAGKVSLPGVLGMARDDGVRALREQGFKPVVERGRGQVVIQKPSARTCVGASARVRLIAAAR